MKKILAIDDKQDNLISLKALMKNYMPDCNVITSISGKEGIALAKKEKPDVILLDIIMPEMDGYAVCKELKNNDHTRHVPIIMITAIKTDMASRVKGMNLGADAFLSKPIDPTELTAQVNVMLRIKAAEDKLREEKRNLESIVSERTDELRESYSDLMQEAQKRNLMEKEIKLTKAFLDGVINAIADPVFVKDENRRFVLVNDALCKTVGRSKEELLGAGDDDMFTPKQSEVFLKNDLEVLKTGKDNLNEESLNNLSSGEVQTIITHKSRYTDTSGSNFLVGVIHDITNRKLTEDKLKENEAQIRIITDNLPILISQIDKDMKYLFANKYYYDVGGFQGSMIGKTVADVIGKDSYSWAYPHMLKALSGESIRFNNSHLDKNNRLMILDTNYIPHVIDGKIESFFVLAIDITERKLAEDKLKESEKKFRALYEDAPMPYHSLDANGLFVDVNKMWLSSLGYERDEVIGKNYIDFLHPEVQAIFVNNFPSLKEKGAVHNVPFKLKHKNGNYIDISLEGRSGYNEDGSFKQTYCVFQDVTQRLEAEKSLLQSEKRYKDLIEMLPESVIETDADLNIIYSNERGLKMTGYSEEDIKNGLNGLDFFTDESRERAIKNLKSRFKGKEPGQIEYMARKKDGTIYPIIFHASSIIHEGKFAGLRSLIMDITERKQAEREILESEERFRNAITYAPFPLMIHADGKVLQLSDEWIKQTGYTLEEIPTIKDWTLKAYGKDAVPSSEFIQELYDIKQVQHDGEWLVQIKDGTHRLWDFSTSPIGKSPEGKNMVMSMASDITERKQAEELLAKRMTELEIFNDAAVDRELMINDLRKEINEMLIKQGKEALYDIVT